MKYTKFIELINDICDTEKFDINEIELGFLFDFDQQSLDTPFQITPVKLPTGYDGNEKSVETLVIGRLDENSMTDKDITNLEINEMTEGKPYVRCETKINPDEE